MGRLIQRLEKGEDIHLCMDMVLEDIEDRFLLNGLAEISRSEAIALAVSTYVGESANGGLNQFLCSDYGELIQFLQEGFREIGLIQLEKMVDEIFALLNGIDTKNSDDLLDRVIEIGSEEIWQVERPFWAIYPNPCSNIWFSEAIRGFILKNAGDFRG